MIKKWLLIVTEGETDEEFYKRLLSHIKTKISSSVFPFEKIDYECAKGIGNMQQKLVRIVKRRFFSSSNNDEIDKFVVLCYDKDVFENNQFPPVDRKKVIKEIQKLGKCKIINIVADRTIEDFFLNDFENIRKFLRLKKEYNSNIKGLKGLEKMFKDANKTYLKGEKTRELINHLDFELILNKIYYEIKELCDILNYKK